MTKSELSSLSKNRFRSNPTAFIGLGVLLCLLIVVSLSLSFINPILGIVAIVIIIFPLLTGIIIASQVLDYSQTVNIKELLFFSRQYYSPKFIGSFSLLTVILKGIIVELASTLVIGIVSFFIFKSIYPGFEEALSSLIAEFSSLEADQEMINGLIESEESLTLFLELTSYIASLLGTFVIIITISFNSLTVYFRTVLTQKTMIIGKKGISLTIKKNRKDIFKDYLYLNWPLLVVIFIGLATGALITLLIIKDLSYGLDISLAFAFLFATIYAPKYLANMCVLFDKYKVLLNEGVSEEIVRTIKTIQRNVDLTDEEKQQIEETLKQFEQNKNDNEEE